PAAAGSSCGDRLPRGVMAGDAMARGLLLQRRRRLPADVARLWTAAGEDAAPDAGLEARHQARNLGQAALLAGERGAELGHGPQEALRVGMARPGEQLLC